MPVKRNIYKQCLHCKQDLEIHHITLHQKLCYLNPDNLQKIGDYFMGALYNTKLLRRTEFYNWALKNKVLTSIRITARMQLATWTETIIQLLIYCYLNGTLDFEYADILIYYATNCDMGIDEPLFRKLSKQALDEEHDLLKLSGYDLYDNYSLLYQAIISRAVSDLRYNEGQLTENKEVVDLDDAITFLMDAAPEKISQAFMSNSISPDAASIYFSYLPP